MICPSCGAASPDGAKFCGECGTALSASCPSCRAEVGPAQRFCHECGTSLAGAPPAPPAAPELRVVSVLFVDLVGYTPLSESRDAEDVRALLSRYFDQARTIVGRYGGAVEKFIGDAVMAVWGAPEAREDDAERAVRAGLDLVAAVAAFGEEVGAPELRARAGVVTGQVASLSSPGEGLVVGDRVNTASRAQSAAAPGTVYVDEVTRHASSAAVAYEDAGEHALKGKAEPLRLWRAVRVVAGSGGRRRDEGVEAPFSGRDAELRMVKELFHSGVERSAPRLVAISGPAGVGKSRLIREFLHYVDGLADSVLWHAGRCLAYGEGVAYWALAEMVRQRLGIPEDAPPSEAARKLGLGLEEWVADPADRAYLEPRLGALLGAAEPGLDRVELFAGWRLFFERLASVEPVVLTFEDLQWADAGLLDFIEHLIEWAADRPIFVLTLARPELVERRPGWAAGRARVTPLFLEPLPDAAIGELLDGVVAGLPVNARDRIVAQAEGIPLYAMETVRALLDRGVLVAGPDGRLALAGELGELEVPSTLTSLLTARLDALTPDERAVVKDVAVRGGSFPRETVVALCGRPAAEVDALLASLVRKQVLTVRADPLSPDQGQYAFAQAMVRTVAYDLLSRSERKPRHLAVARHLRTAFANEGEEVAEAIATHLVDAYRAGPEDADAEEVRAEALAALGRAAARAESVGAPETAERILRTALDLTEDTTERGTLLRQAGMMALRAARTEEAYALFEEAIAVFEDAGRAEDAARVAWRLGKVRQREGRLMAVHDRMREALELLGPERMDPDVAQLCCTLGLDLAYGGRPVEGAPLLERAIAIAEALELPDVLADALTTLGVLCFDSGRPVQAVSLLEGALGVAEQHGLTGLASRAELNLGNVLNARDEPDAQERHERALASARRLGERYFEEGAAANLTYVHIMRGRWDEADRLADEIFASVAERTVGTEFVRFGRCFLRTLQGDVAGARAALALVEIPPDVQDLELRLDNQVFRGMVALAEGDPAAALELIAPAVREAAGAMSPSHESVREGWPAGLDAALALGRLDAARDLVDLLAGEPSGRVPPFLRAQLARGRALVAAASGEEAGVEVDLRAAEAQLRSLAYPYWLARTLTDLAAWLIDQGRAGEAAPLLEEAVEMLGALGAAPALARARELAASVPAGVA